MRPRSITENEVYCCDVTGRGQEGGGGIMQLPVWMGEQQLERSRRKAMEDVVEGRDIHWLVAVG